MVAHAYRCGAVLIGRGEENPLDEGAVHVRAYIPAPSQTRQPVRGTLIERRGARCFVSGVDPRSGDPLLKGFAGCSELARRYGERSADLVR